jgi:hypothetical protein
MSENIKFSIYLYVFYRKFSDQVNILGDMMKHPYTLLADPNLPISIDESLCKAFKAHLIYVLIFNNSIVFSDSQAISSSNLRRLAARDGVIRDLFKNGRFHLAIRRGASEDNVAELLDLDNIQTSFLREGKLIYGQQYSGSILFHGLIGMCETITLPPAETLSRSNFFHIYLIQILKNFLMS